MGDWFLLTNDPLMDVPFLFNELSLIHMFLFVKFNPLSIIIPFRMHDGGEVDVRACYTAISVS